MPRNAASRRRRHLSLDALERREVMSVPGLVLSEVVLNPYPAQQPNQYIEVSGQANASLKGIEFVQFDGYGNGNPTGKADYIVDLSNYSLGANGLLIIEASVNGRTALDGGTNTLFDPNLNAGSTKGLLGGNSTTTFNSLIDTNGNANVPGTKLTVGQSYDPSNAGTGTLTLPTNDVLVDAVSFVYKSDPYDYADQSYSVLDSSQATKGGKITKTTLPLADFFLPVYNQSGYGEVPDAASRVAGDTATPGVTKSYNPTQHFDYGWLQTGNDFYNPTVEAGVIPANGGALTPGASNGYQLVEVAAAAYTATPGSDVAVTVLAGNGSLGTGTNATTVFALTEDGSAVAGTDYTATDVVLTFSDPAKKSTSPAQQVVEIPILTTATGGNEFTLNLSPLNGNYVIDQSFATITIN